MQQQLEQVWLGRPVQSVFAVPAFAGASSGGLTVFDFDAPATMSEPPSVLFRIDPTLANGERNIYAALKDEEPLTFARQFPVRLVWIVSCCAASDLLAPMQEYCGDVHFRNFLEVISRSERFLWTLFTISKPYLPQLLSCAQVKRWAEKFVSKIHRPCMSPYSPVAVLQPASQRSPPGFAFVGAQGLPARRRSE